MYSRLLKEDLFEKRLGLMTDYMDDKKKNTNYLVDSTRMYCLCKKTNIVIHYNSTSHIIYALYKIVCIKATSIA